MGRGLILDETSLPTSDPLVPTSGFFNDGRDLIAGGAFFTSELRVPASGFVSDGRALTAGATFFTCGPLVPPFLCIAGYLLGCSMTGLSLAAFVFAGTAAELKFP